MRGHERGNTAISTLVVHSSFLDGTFSHERNTDAFSRLLPAFVARHQAAVAAQKIRIRLKSFEVKHMAAACDKIIEAAKATEASISGPVPLPTKRRIYCVLRSPHVNKDSREHFETRTHHRLIDVHQPTAQTIDALMGLELPAGVEIEVKL
jgi:small subunit ribosomal protein S10